MIDAVLFVFYLDWLKCIELNLSEVAHKTFHSTEKEHLFTYNGIIKIGA